MLRGSTTGESQPAVVKYGVRANADDADANKLENEVVVVVDDDDDEGDEEVEEEVEGNEEDEKGEEEEVDGGDGAEVPFMAKRAARVRSAWGMKVLLPVRSARW